AARSGDDELDSGLRPRDLSEFVGQRAPLEQLRIALEAARKRGEPPDHVLLSGLPGLGKTSLAHIVANELGAKLHSTTGPALERARDLAGILTQLQTGDCLFIDEVHRVPPAVEEYLYPAMEDYSVDLVIDQGPSSRTVKLRLARFTLLGATTREGLLSAPFRSRFGLLIRLEPYGADDLVKIVRRSARLLRVDIDDAAAREIAGRARGTPRVANRYLRRIRDLAEVNGEQRVGIALARETFSRLRVDERGLEELDRAILGALARAGGPLGLKTLGASVGEETDAIENLHEPFLLREGLIDRTPRGRVLTKDGFAAIGRRPPDVASLF
ncbi:MAG TPA: Holliday junction branch migration DNA helicase RuvB, partial [Planctomycetota bacterium]|nr:Holliday junction branch migration DNA helicase RuvB [Planctomycetota bacterium]